MVRDRFSVFRSQHLTSKGLGRADARPNLRHYVAQVRIVIYLLILLLPSAAFSCVTDPAYKVVKNPEKFMERADMAFFGILLASEDRAHNEQDQLPSKFSRFIKVQNNRA